jgi:hypothetical protein
MNSNIIEDLTTATEDSELERVKVTVEGGGYSSFSLLLDDFKMKLLQSEEHGLDQAATLIMKARMLFPNPSDYSPSWENIWEDLDQVITFKREVLANVQPEHRNGEWQVIIDNPMSIEGVICHLAGSFVKAAYLYAYFQKGLAKNECITLQKVWNIMNHNGK